MTPPRGWDRVMRRLLPGWFRDAWGREVRDLLRAEEDAARSRGRGALLRFRLATTADLIRAAWQTRRSAGTGLSGDVRLAFRHFRRAPGFTAVVVLSLATGVALAATGFSVLDPAFTRPLPFPDADRLFALRVATYQATAEGDSQRTRQPSYAQFKAWQAEVATVETSADVLVAFQRRFQQQEAPGGVEDPFADILVQAVSPGFLSLVGARVSQGRNLVSDDHRSGAPPVVLATHPFWQRKLHGRPDVVGAKTKINGAAYTIVGVLAPDFQFGSQTPELIRPIVAGADTEPGATEFVEVVARLKEGVAMERLTAELGSVLGRNRTAKESRPPEALAEPLRARLYGWARSAYGPFAGVAALLLLLVTANVANLTLVHAGRRRQEMVLRTALGAGRGRLARLVAVEAGLLSLGACVAGLFLAWWTIDLLVALNPRGVGAAHPVFDLRTVLFGGAVGLVLGALAALWPGLTVVRRERPGALRHGPQHGTDSPRQRFSQRALVIGQIACALVVLTGAGLLAKTVIRMESYEPGIDARGLLTAYLDVPTAISSDRGGMAVVNRLLDDLRTVPGVRSAGAIHSEGPAPVSIRSHAGESHSITMAETDRIVQISPDYFETLGVPVARGRLPAAPELLALDPIALVNEEAVRRWWTTPDSAIGSQIKVGEAAWVTVIGVLKNTGPLTVQSLAWAPAARIFVPLAQSSRSMILYARTEGEPVAILPALHTRTLAIDRRLRIQMPADAQANLDWEISGHRDTATFVGGLAAFGLLLAAMGIYGVTTYAVGRRVREIGIRKALGASSGHVVFTVSRETAWLALCGISIGLVTSAAVTRMLTAMLYGTSPLDAWVFTGAALVTLGIVAIATWVPTRTALRVDPMTTLRCE